jgi:hypothetical protein
MEISQGEADLSAWLQRPVHEPEGTRIVPLGSNQQVPWGMSAKLSQHFGFGLQQSGDFLEAHVGDAEMNGAFQKSHRGPPEVGILLFGADVGQPVIFVLAVGHGFLRSGQPSEHG